MRPILLALALLAACLGCSTHRNANADTHAGAEPHADGDGRRHRSGGLHPVEAVKPAAALSPTLVRRDARAARIGSTRLSNETPTYTE